MKPERIESLIDDRIIKELSEGNSLIDVYNNLVNNINKFSKREDFLDVSEVYIKSNWSIFNFKEKYSTYYVIFSKKRKGDIMWLLINKEFKFKSLNDIKLFNLIKLRDKLKDHVTS